MSLLSRSGGLIYHLRALRYRSGLWLPFRAAIERWLREQLPSGDELMLIGPSGGHCLPAELWQRFRRFSVLEPDPVARRILVSRVGAGRVQFEHRDLLLEPLLSGKPGLDGLLEVRPRASVLFCNLLGQLHWQLSDREQSRFRAEFRRRWLPLLHGRPWASFHDRWSLDCSAGEAGPQTMRFGCAPSDHELGVAWFGASGPTVTVLDHGTLALFPEALPRSYFSWQITPHARHIVEGVAA